MTQNNTLKPQQEKAIDALLSCKTLTDAAKKIKSERKTLYRWLQDDDAFKQAYRTARAEIVRHSITRLQKASSAAVDTLEQIMNNEETPPHTRASAARTILEMSFRAIETEDIIARVEQLENTIQD